MVSKQWVACTYLLLKRYYSLAYHICIFPLLWSMLACIDWHTCKTSSLYLSKANLPCFINFFYFVVFFSRSLANNPAKLFIQITTKSENNLHIFFLARLHFFCRKRHFYYYTCLLAALMPYNEWCCLQLLTTFLLSCVFFSLFNENFK